MSSGRRSQRRAAYPELQDWAARRGHGGAASASPEGVAAEIARLRGEGADTVIVQFHAGFQFAERPSEGLQLLARHAIDDGADIVVAHHPHVLQGFEWYQGRLIAYSLGNLMFDQDFLVTYPSAMLRVVIAGDQLVEARVIPLLLVDYRPVPVAGHGGAMDRPAARHTLRAAGRERPCERPRRRRRHGRRV